MARKKTEEESHLSSSDSKQSVSENTYGYTTAIKASILYRTFSFNEINTGFFRTIAYWIWIILVTVALNIPLTFLYHDYNRIKKIAKPLGVIVSNTFFILLFGALLLGKTSKNIKKPTYAQILTLIFVSFTYLPITTLIYFFLRKQSTVVRSNYACVSALIPFVFIVKNLNAIWKFTHYKFFFILFYILLYFMIVGNLQIFYLMMHGTNSELDDLLKPTSFDF